MYCLSATESSLVVAAAGRGAGRRRARRRVRGIARVMVGCIRTSMRRPAPALGSCRSRAPLTDCLLSCLSLSTPPKQDWCLRLRLCCVARARMPSAPDCSARCNHVALALALPLPRRIAWRGDHHGGRCPAAVLRSALHRRG